ncbi:MAG: antitermination protein NusG [Chlamydiae bacterium SM23_39]|nr:MAG: antitermination protein NusG [Chlamydiae bacterium SM23_39]
MHKWYVVQVISGKEKRVKKAIDDNKEDAGMKDLVEDIVVPSEMVSEVKMGEQKITEKRIWPGYILVKMVLNDESWDFIKKINGVVGFLGGKNPTPLSEKEISELMRYLEEKKEKVVHKHKVEIGDTVKIIDGVFVNFIGTVIEVNREKGRVSVMVSIFGRDTRVDDLEFWQVEELIKE